jgi:hypothetical protein
MSDRRLLRLLVPCLLVLVLLVGAVTVVRTDAAPAGAGAPHSASALTPSAAGGVARSLPGPVAPAATPAAHPSVSCPTPQIAPDWDSANFFSDALVEFEVPGYTNLSGTNFNAVPCLNILPTYLQSFYMNISTNVPLSEAYVTIWGTTFPTPTDPLPALDGFNPEAPELLPMEIPIHAPNTASFLFNLYRYFYPGTTVYFNVTLESADAAPATISSTESSYRSEVPSGSGDNATWQFYVQAPWWSPEFANDIIISTDPSILGNVSYDPNPEQAFSVGIRSVTATGGVGPAIPMARFQFTLSKAYQGTFSLPFGPQNTSQQVVQPITGTGIGPYPGAEVTFQITAWLPWGQGPDGQQGAIDEITSQNYTFNWSSGGGWQQPSLGLERNADLTATPNVFNLTSLPTGTPVNITIHVPVPNETISSSILRFSYSDPVGHLTGNLPMQFLSDNTTYVVIPGLPAGGNLTFSLLAKDVFHVPLSTGNYSYGERGVPTSPIGAGENWLFIEALNLSTGLLIPGATYSFTNASWTAVSTTNALGFGAIVASSGVGYRLLGDGVYQVTATVFDRTLSIPVTLQGAMPVLVEFGFEPPNAPLGGTATVQVTPYVVALVAGPIVATAALFPLLIWYRQRQAKAAAEQKRITL